MSATYEILVIDHTLGVEEPYRVLTSVQLPFTEHRRGLHFGLMAGLLGYMRKHPTVRQDHYVIRKRFELDDEYWYAWDAKRSGMRFHSPSHPNIIQTTMRYHHILRVHPGANLHGAFWQITVPDDDTEFMAGFTEGVNKFPVTLDDVLYRE